MRGLISWFAGNGVAANLLMALILFCGGLVMFTLRQEVFPEFSTDLVSVAVPYPGAAPKEVENGVITRIEEAVQDLDGIKKITATASEGAGSVLIEVLPGNEPRRVMEDVKNRVDAIDTFPVEAEEPIVQELLLRREVINVAVSGNADEKILRRIAEHVRDDIAGIPGITQVVLAAVRPYEISIEVSEETLRQYGLTFSQVADAVRRASLDLPGGSIRTEAGEVLLRTEGQAYVGDEFEKLVLLTRPDGSRLLLRDVATIVDGFAETDQSATFDGEPAALVKVFRVGEQDAIEIADAVKAYISEAQQSLPPGISLTLWQDDTETLRDRLDTLIRNGRTGLALVVMVLALFMNLRLAGWVSLGIPISFLGAFALMPVMDVTINLISLFAFIVVLGIVVDDAIVVGENIFRHHQRGEEGLHAARVGALEVSGPVIFAVLTTICAFLPLMFLPGNMGKFLKYIPMIVILVLIFSLVESLLILPAHLSHVRRGRRQRAGIPGAWARFQGKIADGLMWLNEKTYGPTLERAIEWRYLSLAVGVAVLILTAAIVASGRIRVTFFPPVAADNVVAMLTMPQGTPSDQTADAIARLETAALELREEIKRETGQDVFRHVLATVGEQPYRLAQQQHGGGIGNSFSGSHLGEVNIELVGAGERNISGLEISDRWRRKVGPVPDAVELNYTSQLFGSGEDIDVELSGPDIEALRGAAEDIKTALHGYAHVADITDTFRAGKQEIKLEITPEAEALGISLADLARQVRQAFYGEEAQRIQRGRDEVKVMVRYPEEQRRSLADLESLRIRAPGGIEVPFPVAGRVETGRGFASIQRADRRRVVNVIADVDEPEGNANEIVASLKRDVMPTVVANHPGIRYAFEGGQQEQSETLGGVRRGFAIAMFLIYALLAIPFRSYFQPLVVMSAIPFGLIGAIGGHMLFGLDLTLLSFFGIVALTGVVVNDSLIMVDFINREYRHGVSMARAIREAGHTRFRPIILTSLTTFAGLLPLLLERSLQAQFLIPMAISLAFGVLFATMITLVLVPVLYAILEDVKSAVRRWLGLAPLPRSEPATPASAPPAELDSLLG